MNNPQKILVVDDDPDILEFLSYNLDKEGFIVEIAGNGKDAIDLAGKYNPDVILLDIMMPEMDGVEVCHILRSSTQFDHTLIVFLTARSEDYSQIAGFDAGADDYITKPVRPKVLIKKIQSMLRRSNRLSNRRSDVDEAETVLRFNGLTIDVEMHSVMKNGAEVILPKKEFKLLKLLVSKPGKVFSRDEIYSAIWGDEVIVGERAIDVHVRKLREKIGDEFIRTFKGTGYKFEYRPDEQ
ncbi:MAG: response regulator transcription factor [Bacteroidales bacterium]|nr:response regulator transcription factor [Bacteroidales bacterium]HOY39042.1 response regulator transcription factor [Bacteroidales bacterium]HQP03395.1 response regulator transcription factor [Bacteroidales bacterium]